MPTTPNDYFYDGSWAAPAADGLQITPSDVSNLSQAVRGVYCGTAGTVRITTPRGTILDFTVPAGGYIPFWTIKVAATGTTVTNLVGSI